MRKTEIEAKNQVKKNGNLDIDKLELNLQLAINDIIDECDFLVNSDFDLKNITMIITHLAMAAASLRIKKQKKRKLEVAQC